MNQIEHLYMPGSVPIYGMRSGVDPASLARGYWRLIDNWRIGRNSAQGRLGCDELTSGLIVASASYRGSWSGYVGTTEMVYVALRVSGATRIYESQTGSTFAEVTGVSTRFSTDGFVEFAPCRDPGIVGNTNIDYVVAVNGTDVPRVVKFNILGSTAYIANGFSFDTANKPTCQPIPWGWTVLRDAANTTYVNSGANLVSADSGATTEQNEWSVTFGTATAVNDTSYCIAANSSSLIGTDLTTISSTQLWVVCYDSVADPVWNYLDFEVYNGSTYDVVHSATGTSRNEPQYYTLGGGYYLVSFPLPLQTNVTGYLRYQLKCKRTTAVARTFKIAGILASGPVPGETLYTFTHARDETMVESPPRDAEILGTGPLMEYGMSKDLAYKLPYASTLDFVYDPRVPAHDVASDADSVYVYRKQPDDEDFFLCYRFDMPTAGTVGGSAFPDTTSPQDRGFYRTAPTFGTVTIPSGSTVAASGDRIIVGKGNEVWASQKGYPFRFNQLFKDDDDDGIPDADSPTLTRFPGELVKRIHKMPGSMLGIAPILVFTTHGVHRMESADTEGLSRPTRMNAHGTYCPRTVAEHRGLIHYLDADLIVRRFAGGIEIDPISQNRVDDQLEGGDMDAATACVYKDRYYLAHRASGASINQRVLVYDPQLGEWVRDSYTTAAQNWAGMHVIGSGSSRKMIALTEEGRCYQLEKAGQLDDDGTAISGTLTTGELHDDMWHQRVWGSVGVVVDDIASGTWTVTRTNEYDAGTGSGPGTINVDVSTTRAFRWEKSSKTGLVDSGITAAALRLSITGKVVSGKYLKAVVIKYGKGRVVPAGDRP